LTCVTSRVEGSIFGQHFDQRTTVEVGANEEGRLQHDTLILLTIIDQ